MKKLLLSIAVALTCLSAVAQVRVVGHRGCRFNTPAEPETPLYENTLAALKFAQCLGIYAAEFDVQLTSDGKPIVQPSFPEATGCLLLKSISSRPKRTLQ